jgi:hypothetical protein
MEQNSFSKYVFAMVMGGVLLYAPIAAANFQTESFQGNAYDSNGNLAYIENHTVTYTDGEVVESQTVYLDQNRRLIGKLVSEYSQGPQFGSYEFQDLRARYKDGAEVQDKRIKLFRRETPDDQSETRFLPRKDNQIVGQGFHQFIRTQLEAIAAGEVFHVELVLPSQLNQYRFRIRKLKIEGDVLYVRLEIDNWILRIFAPHVDADYNLKTRQLLRYEGISNMTDAAGKHKIVTIKYSYPG